MECRLWGGERCRVRSVKCGVESVRSVNCRVWRAESGVQIVKCKVWSVKCTVWSVKCGV